MNEDEHIIAFLQQPYASKIVAKHGEIIAYRYFKAIFRSCIGLGEISVERFKGLCDKAREKNVTQN